jgi:uncharacterized protein YbjT (DUF2867 family)
VTFDRRLKKTGKTSELLFELYDKKSLNMKILLTGATGYIGKRLLPVLLEKGHQVVACVRDADSLDLDDISQERLDQVEVFEVDFLEPVDTDKAPKDFDAAYYLIHSMSSSITDFQDLEAQTARNFVDYMDQSEARQIIYLTGIVNEQKLSRHLQSRLRVEQILNESRVPLTALRAGIIIGSGSASFEIIRDLVEKLPLMVAPIWIKTRCQPIGISDVLLFLTGVLLREDTFNKNYDIGGEDVLTYKEMMLQYAEVRELKRWIFTVPVMTPRLSSYWLYFVTSVTYPLAVNLVKSMKIDVLVRDNELEEKLNIQPISYKEAVQRAFSKIKQNVVISSWKDALVTTSRSSSLGEHIQVPEYGCFTDKKQLVLDRPAEEVWGNIRAIGGERGWYYGSWLWKIRGYLDKLVGGIGLRRGRTHPTDIHAGDALDFWRVLRVDHKDRRLLLFAEMKLPGEAWLEFDIRREGDQEILYQTATFRPHGLWGRLYWYGVLPFHFFVFSGMIRNIVGFGRGDL